MSTYGCNNCYRPADAESATQGLLRQFYVQSLTGVMYLISLCGSCEKILHEIEERDSINEGLNFIQDIVKNNKYRFKQ